MQYQRMSLTFNQSTRSLSNPININEINPINVSVGMQSVNTFSTINITDNFNKQFNDIYSNLNASRHEYQQKVNDLLASGNKSNDSLRNKGVELAWKYEQAEIQLGGKGTTDWTVGQRKEIIETGRVRGSEGHHINNVSENPSQQANPDNIRFAKDRAEHLEMHDGDWRNPTSGERIDRSKHLKKANNKRVLKNELSGIGSAIAIGMGVGFTLGFLATLAQSGLSPESLRNATAIGGKAGIEGAALGIMNHIVVRGIGEIVNNSIQGVIENLGLTITDNIVKMSNMAVVGGLGIIIFSVYQFTKLKLLGYGTKESLLRVGKSATFSITILLASIVSQGIWGGHAGIIVSISIGFIVLTYSLISNQHNKRIGEQVRIYMIQKCEPTL